MDELHSSSWEKTLKFSDFLDMESSVVVAIVFAFFIIMGVVAILRYHWSNKKRFEEIDVIHSNKDGSSEKRQSLGLPISTNGHISPLQLENVSRKEKSHLEISSPADCSSNTDVDSTKESSLEKDKSLGSSTSNYDHIETSQMEKEERGRECHLEIPSSADCSSNGDVHSTKESSLEKDKSLGSSTSNNENIKTYQMEKEKREGECHIEIPSSEDCSSTADVHSTKDDALEKEQSLKSLISNKGQISPQFENENRGEYHLEIQSPADCSSNADAYSNKDGSLEKQQSLESSISNKGPISTSQLENGDRLEDTRL